jgi:predicted CoA-binding protein
VGRIPDSIADFLGGRRIAVASVSRRSGQAANVVFSKLMRCGYDVVPVNPKVSVVEGVECYPDVAAVPGALDGVVVATGRVEDWRGGP